MTFDEILSMPPYSLNSEEYARLRRCGLLLGRQEFQFCQFRGEMLEAVDSLSDILEQKEIPIETRLLGNAVYVNDRV